jgi:hypothetical protein
MHNSENPTGWQRNLRFEDDEVWTMLPEQVREHCRTLWGQLLASVLKEEERRRNERQD